MREIHEIRERLYEEQKGWSDEQKRAYYDRVGGGLAVKLGLKRVPHASSGRARKAS
jgi:hypothetical protein